MILKQIDSHIRIYSMLVKNMVNYGVISMGILIGGWELYISLFDIITLEGKLIIEGGS